DGYEKGVVVAAATDLEVMRGCGGEVVT
ncbi:hypothetical protein A2U01_0099691, partial [Trifolium medium]|nr:hypothetical protein [Trifolium medium]